MDAQLMDVAGQAELLDEGLRVLAEIGRQRLAVPHRQQPLAEENRDRDASGQPAERRQGRIRNSRSRAGPASCEASKDEHVHRRAREREHRSRMGAEHQRHQHLRRRTRPSRTAITTMTGQKRRDGAVDADERGQERDHQHHQDDQSRCDCRRHGRSAPAGPGRDAGPLEPRADDEQRRHEDRRRVAESGKALIDREHPVAQRASAQPYRPR